MSYDREFEDLKRQVERDFAYEERQVFKPFYAHFFIAVAAQIFYLVYFFSSLGEPLSGHWSTYLLIALFSLIYAWYQDYLFKVRQEKIDACVRLIQSEKKLSGQ